MFLFATYRKPQPQLMSNCAIDEGYKARLVPRAEVFFHRRAPGRGAQDRDDMGDGILCTITAVLGDGKTKRYEILDADDGITSYRASLSQIVLIPRSNDALPDLHPKKRVLAMYPGTTTFYRAEVVLLKAKDLDPGLVRLRFEDEDNENTEMDVSRRYVLVDWPGK
jgi:SAGA-associated factor 29